METSVSQRRGSYVRKVYSDGLIDHSSNSNVRNSEVAPMSMIDPQLEPKI
jgi:hypothetical protein